MVYAWKEGVFFKADAEKVVGEIKDIGPQCTPEEILKKAQDDSTELHKCYEWDDEKAAHLYRIDQSRLILRSVVVYEEPEEGEEPEYYVRAFENVATPSGKAYVPIEQALGEDEYCQQVMNEIYKAIIELERKAEAYERYSDVFLSIRERLQEARLAMPVENALSL